MATTPVVTTLLPAPRVAFFVNHDPSVTRSRKTRAPCRNEPPRSRSCAPSARNEKPVSKTRRSLIFSFLDRYGTAVLNLVGTLLLARLLSPRDFGIYSSRYIGSCPRRRRAGLRSGQFSASGARHIRYRDPHGVYDLAAAVGALCACAHRRFRLDCTVLCGARVHRSGAAAGRGLCVRAVRNAKHQPAPKRDGVQQAGHH